MIRELSVELSYGECVCCRLTEFSWRVTLFRSTEAYLNDHPLHVREEEGTPPFPSEIDDEYITAQGVFTQPSGKLSYLSGFVRNVKIFPVIREAIVRSRSLRRRLILTAEAKADALSWLNSAETRLMEVTNDLPVALCTPERPPDSDDIQEVIRGIQRANIFVTAISARFAVVSRICCGDVCDTDCSAV